MMLKSQAGVARTPKYVGDMLANTQHVIQYDLSANENALGPSVLALEAFKESMHSLHRYPDGGHQALREAIAKHHQLDVSRIACGAGSDELITLLTRTFAGEGDEIIYSEYGFIMYLINAIRIGAVPVKAPAIDLGTDVKSILSAITPKTKLIFVANPNNPTGTYLTRDEIALLVSQVPSHILLVLDAAYAEYVCAQDYEDGLSFVDKYPNIIVLRTFSKMYALAGLRLGWCYSSTEVIDLIERARNPYNISLPAQDAGIAALKDQAHVKKSKEHNQIWLDKLTHSMRKIGISVQSSVCNFLLAGFEQPEKTKQVYEYLIKKGILTRPMGGYDLHQFLRITVGHAAENEYLLNQLEKF